MHLVRINREMHQSPLAEPEQRRTRLTICAVLTDRVPPRLTRRRVLQFARRHRHTVERKQQINRVVLARMAASLAGHRQLVGAEQRQRIGIQAVRGPEVRQPERLAHELEAVTQHLQSALQIKLPDQPLQQPRHNLSAL